MKENVFAIEISHKFIKVVNGFSNGKQVYINYCKKIPLDHYLENGMIIDKEMLVKELNKIRSINDQQLHFSASVNDAILVLPPYGLEAYRTSQFTSVISPEKIIEETDVRNLYSIIRNKKLPVNNDLIEIIPEYFQIESGKKYALPPIGTVSSSITGYVKVHSLPNKINVAFSDALTSSGIDIYRKTVSSFAAVELLSTYEETPDHYFLIDVGGESTTVSLVGNKQLIATRSFSFGGDNITDAIVQTFNINVNEAEKIKTLYGLDKREMKFDYPVVSKSGEDGMITHNIKELNGVIESSLEDFYKSLNIVIEQLALAYNVQEYSKLPILLIGGGSKLRGFTNYLKDKTGNPNINLVSPKTIGARDPSMFSVLGAIYINHRYPNLGDEAYHQIVSVSRED